MSSWVRESFYIPPPAKDAPVEQWSAWLKADRALAIQAKRAHTMSLKAEPENARLWAGSGGQLVKGGDGVYRQSSGFVGFESAGEDSSKVVAAVGATQDRHHQARGTKGAEKPTSEVRKGRKANARAAKRARLLGK